MSVRTIEESLGVAIARLVLSQRRMPDPIDLAVHLAGSHPDWVLLHPFEPHEPWFDFRFVRTGELFTIALHEGKVPVISRHEARSARRGHHL